MSKKKILASPEISEGKAGAASRVEERKTLIDPKKATHSMLSSLEDIESCLKCPLCNQLMIEPSTLSCTHSFCLRCISSRKAWACPVEGCNLPVTLGGKKSYTTNPQLSSVIMSLNNIANVVNAAKPGWWKSNALNDTVPTVSTSLSMSMSVSMNVEGDCGKDDRDDDEDQEVVNFSVMRNGNSHIQGGTGDQSKQHILDGDNDNKDEFKFLGLDSPSPLILKGKRRKMIPSTKEVELSACSNAKLSDIQGQQGQKKPIEEKKSTETEDVSIDTQQYDIDKTSQEEFQMRTFASIEEGDENDNDESELLYCWTDNHTPKPFCPNLSPIAKVGSQSLSESISLGMGEDARTPGFRGKVMKENTDDGKNNVGTVDSDYRDTEHGTAEKATAEENSRSTEENSRSTEEHSMLITNTNLKKRSTPNSTTDETLVVSDPSSSVNGTLTNSKVQIDPPMPLVLLLSPPTTLIAADQRCIRKCLKKGQFKMLQPHSKAADLSDLDFGFDFESKEDIRSFLDSLYCNDGNSHTVPAQYAYAICSNAEFQTCDGYIVPRSFRYILAMACGVSIMDFSFLRAAGSISAKRGFDNYLYVPGTVKMDDCGNNDRGALAKRRKRSRGKVEEEKEAVYGVAGDVCSTNFMAPQRSRQALLRKLNSGEILGLDCNYSNGLLHDYSVFLCGEFDVIPVKLADTSGNNNTGKKRKRTRTKSPTPYADQVNDDSYTRARVRMLLELCGASVGDLSNDETDGQNVDTARKNLVVLTRHVPNDGLRNASTASLKRIGLTAAKIKNMPFVSCRWLEDSIAEFSVKDVVDYSKEKCK